MGSPAFQILCLLSPSGTREVSDSGLQATTWLIHHDGVPLRLPGPVCRLTVSPPQGSPQPSHGLLPPQANGFPLQGLPQPGLQPLQAAGLPQGLPPPGDVFHRAQLLAAEHLGLQSLVAQSGQPLAATVPPPAATATTTRQENSLKTLSHLKKTRAHAKKTSRPPPLVWILLKTNPPRRLSRFSGPPR